MLSTNIVRSQQSLLEKYLQFSFRLDQQLQSDFLQRNICSWQHGGTRQRNNTVFEEHFHCRCFFTSTLVCLQLIFQILIRKDGSCHESGQHWELEACQLTASNGRAIQKGHVWRVKWLAGVRSVRPLLGYDWHVCSQLPLPATFATNNRTKTTNLRRTTISHLRLSMGRIGQDTCALSSTFVFNVPLLFRLLSAVLQPT